MSAGALGQDWRIPAAGNVFRVDTDPGVRSGTSLRRGVLLLNRVGTSHALFFRVDRPASLRVALVAKAGEGEGEGVMEADIQGRQTRARVVGGEWADYELGAVEVEKSGYVRVDLKAVALPESGIEVRELHVVADESGVQLDYVRNNDGNMFYWGRRGPSVHLRYEVPSGVDLTYAYSEIVVPEGQDPIGSYFMANGFGEGYFGIQVNSETERRVLFSVWSPFRTDNPRDIPVDQQIRSLGRGPEVHVGEFGNEGSGGQSYLRYPWEAGRTYRFLTEVKPDGEGNTQYTSWFGDKERGEWRLIASFSRPKTDTHLRGFHSFLENFSAEQGHRIREGRHANIWVRDTRGKWYECVRARFSVDATGAGRHRLDYTGGAVGNQFYMRNGGFFAEPGRPGDVFERDSSASEPPVIDFEALPRGEP